jgi:uncharacterized membrane protein YeaQ/YmgE (transglycosylase-associated protein family)
MGGDARSQQSPRRNKVGRQQEFRWRPCGVVSSDRHVKTGQAMRVHGRGRHAGRHITKENLMGIIAWIALGAAAGFIAEQLTGRRTGLLLATLVGIAGAVLGGFLARALFNVQTLDTFFDLSTWLTAIAGATILFLLMRLLSGRRSSDRRA